MTEVFFELVSILMHLVSTAFHYYKYTLEAETVVRHGDHPLLRMPLRLDRKHTASLPGEGAPRHILPLGFMDDEQHAGLVSVLHIWLLSQPLPITQIKLLHNTIPRYYRAF